MCKKTSAGLFILSAIIMIAVVAANIQGKKGIVFDASKGKMLSDWVGVAVAFFLSFSSFWLLKYHKTV